jgi:predicted secreted protein
MDNVARRSCLVAAAVLAIRLTASCSSKDDAQATPSPAQRTKSVTYTEKDAGKTATLNVGDFLVIELPETPGTGYAWEVAKKPSSTVLAKRTDRLLPLPEASGPPIAGRPQTHRFTFQAVGAGRASIALDLMPPGNGGKPEGTYSVGVKVA